MNPATQPASQEAANEVEDMHFLNAWKQAVQLAGPSLFGCQAEHPETATHWHQLTPKLDVIRKAIPNRAKYEAVFLAAVASFYNSTEGQKLLNKVDCSFGDLAVILKPQQRAIIAELLVTFQGW